MTDNDSDDERRLRRVLDTAAPDFPPIVVTDLHSTENRRRHRRWRLLAPVAASVAVIALVLGLVLTRERSGAPVTESVGAAAATRLAQRAPCSTARTAANLGDQRAVQALHAVVAVQCGYTALTYPDGSRWQVLIRQVSTAGLLPVVRALSAPDDLRPPAPGTACSLVGYGPLQFLLAGRTGAYLHPGWPKTVCGGPPRALTDAVRKIVWRTVSITRLSRAPVQPASDAGCALQGESDVPTAHSASTRPDASPVTTICSYLTLDDRGDGMLIGSLDKVHTVADWTRLVDAFGGGGLHGPVPGSESSCANQNQYLIVHRADGSAFTVEAGGCWRVVADTTAPVLVGTLSASARAAVTAVLDD